jgi:hypothetical protein
MTLKAEKFEELLSQELSSQLEPQRGKALAAFRAQTLEQQPMIAGTLVPPRDISRGETWFWASVPTLAAACLAVVVTLKLFTPAAPAGSRPQDPAIAGQGTPAWTPQRSPDATPVGGAGPVFVGDNNVTPVPPRGPETRKP